MAYSARPPTMPKRRTVEEESLAGSNSDDELRAKAPRTGGAEGEAAGSGGSGSGSESSEWDQGGREGAVLSDNSPGYSPSSPAPSAGADEPSEVGEEQPATTLEKAKERIASLREQLKAETDRASKAEMEVARLKACEAAQLREITRLAGKAGEEPPANVSGPAGASSALVPAAAASVALAPGAPTPGRSLLAGMISHCDVGFGWLPPIPLAAYQSRKPPHNWASDKIFFPHRLRSDGKSDMAVNVVYSRVNVEFTLILAHRVTERKLSERDLPAQGPVNFNLELCFASSGEPVQEKDLKGKTDRQFWDPPRAKGQHLQMHDGKIVIRLKIKLLSGGTTGGPKSEFILRASCVNPELEDYHLQWCSNPFLVVSRDASNDK